MSEGYRGRLLLALVRPAEDVEGAGVGVTLIDVHHPEVNVKATRPPTMERSLIGLATFVGNGSLYIEDLK